MEQQSKLATLALRPLCLAQSWEGRKKEKANGEVAASLLPLHRFRFILDIRKEVILYCADGEALEQAA